MEVREILCQWGSSLKDLIFPRRCIACGNALERDEKHICQRCFDDLPLTRFWLWDDNPAERRMHHLVGIEKAVSLFFYRYDSPFRDITPAIKYRGEVKLGLRMGRLLGMYMKESGRFEDVQIAVPVPLHPVRRWKRGYNQAEIIAGGIAGAMGTVVVADLIFRRKMTRSQTRLSGDEKRANLKGAFGINRKRALELQAKGITGVILVDDVLTSGATLEAASSVLLPYFAVSVATLGYVE